MTLGNELLGLLLGTLLEKSTSRELKLCRHELVKGGDMRVAMGNHSLSSSFREAFPWAGRGSDSQGEGDSKLKLKL